jgi:hypothetical protein
MKQDSNILAALIRKVDNPKDFPKNIYSGGLVIGYNSKKKDDDPFVEYGKGFFTPKADAWYFVSIGTPVALDGWEGRWKDVMTGVEIAYTFDLHITCNTNRAAKSLIESLHSHHKLEDKLKQIIEKEVDKFLGKILNKNSHKLLEIFDAASGLLKRDYNEEISESIGKKFDQCDVRFGLRLSETLPSTVTIKKETSFSIADSGVPRSITSSASFVPMNLGQIIASRLSQQQSAKDFFEKKINEVVTEHLAARPYYYLIQYFDVASQGDKDINKPAKPLSEIMKEHIARIAEQVGYRCEMYQSITDLVVLPLVRGCRVDIDGKKDAGFKTKDSMGIVQIDIGVDVKINDFNKVQKFISPDEKNLSKISKEIIAVCTDCLAKVSQIDFNLKFEEVERDLTENIRKKLNTYGFDANVILCRPLPTEEAERLKALEGQPRPFSFEVSPQATGGDGVPVPYTGEFEVTGITEDGWAAFVRKSSEYSSESIHSNSVPDDPQKTIEEREKSRKKQAVENELKAIGLRISACLRETLAVAPDLALITRDKIMRRQISEGIEKKAKKIIADEFGLYIEIRQLNREDTISDIYGLELIRNGYKTRDRLQNTNNDLSLNLASGNSTAIIQRLNNINERIGELRENLLDAPDDEDILEQIETLETERNSIMEQNNVKGYSNTNSTNFLDREQNNTKLISNDNKNSSDIDDISGLF